MLDFCRCRTLHEVFALMNRTRHLSIHPFGRCDCRRLHFVFVFGIRQIQPAVSRPTARMSRGLSICWASSCVLRWTRLHDAVEELSLSRGVRPPSSSASSADANVTKQCWHGRRASSQAPPPCLPCLANTHTPRAARRCILDGRWPSCGETGISRSRKLCRHGGYVDVAGAVSDTRLTMYRT